MLDIEKVIRILEEEGPQTAKQLASATGLSMPRVRAVLGNGRKAGWIQSSGRKAGKPAAYAITAREYRGHEGNKHPVVWHTNDGMAWVLPSVMTFARVRGIALGHAARSILSGWKIYGEVVEKLS